MTNAHEPEPILVVDDEPGIRNILARGLWDAGYQCAVASDAQEALGRLRNGAFALMLSDIRMPGMDGVELLEQALREDPDLTVIMVTAMAGLQTALSAIRAGAYDYITKPFQITEVELMVKRALEHRRLRMDNIRHVTQLEKLVEQRTRQVRRLSIDVISAFALALEAKDDFTHDHSRRVAELSALIGQQMKLSDVECNDLRLAGTLYDIGKIGVRESVLNKPGELTPDEFRHIRLHPDLGARILSPLQDLARIIPAIRHHHERWDGTGYPDGLAAEAIPLGARIIGLADTYVAMREARPFRPAMRKERVLNEITLGARRLFDLHAVNALLALESKGKLDPLDEGFPQDLPGLYIA